jgi:hypothetical protein
MEGRPMLRTKLAVAFVAAFAAMLMVGCGRRPSDGIWPSAGLARRV